MFDPEEQAYEETTDTPQTAQTRGDAVKTTATLNGVPEEKHRGFMSAPSNELMSIADFDMFAKILPDYIQLEQMGKNRGDIAMIIHRDFEQAQVDGHGRTDQAMALGEARKKLGEDVPLEIDIRVKVPGKHSDIKNAREFADGFGVAVRKGLITQFLNEQFQRV